MTRVGWIRIDLKDGEESRYWVHGYNDMLMTNNLEEVLEFVDLQLLAIETINGMLPVGKDDNS